MSRRRSVRPRRSRMRNEAREREQQQRKAPADGVDVDAQTKYAFPGEGKNKGLHAGEYDGQLTFNAITGKDAGGGGAGNGATYSGTIDRTIQGGLKDFTTLPETRNPQDATVSGTPGAPRLVDLDGKAADNFARQMTLTEETPPAPPVAKKLAKFDDAEQKKSLLSIGFDFELPAGSQPLHFTTASNQDMQLSLTVVPRASVERAGRAARALVVLLVAFAVVKLGLLRAGDKKIARALALVVAGSLAGLIFVHVAFAAVAVLASLGALVRARSLRAA